MKNTELDNLLRTKLLMNYKNNKTLSENILTLKNKLLLEQGFDSNDITDKQLRYAYENDCLKTRTNNYKFVSYPKIKGPSLFLDRSADPSKAGKEYVYVYSDPNNPLQFAFDYVDKNTGKQNGDTKYSTCPAFFNKTIKNNATDIIGKIDQLVNSKGYLEYDQIKQDQAIIIIRNGLINVPLVTDQEINLSATLAELAQL